MQPIEPHLLTRYLNYVLNKNFDVEIARTQFQLPVLARVTA